MEKQPALKAIVLFAGGILAGHYLQPPFLLSLIIVSAVAMSTLLLHLLRRSSSVVGLLLLLGLTGGGLLRYQATTELRPHHHLSRLPELKGYLTVSGRIIEDPQIGEKGTKFCVQLDGISISDTSFRASGTIQVSLKEPTERFAYGDQVQIFGQLSWPSPASNPGQFDYQSWLRRQGIDRMMRLETEEQVKVIGRGGGFFTSKIVVPLRHFILDAVDGGLEGAPAALLKGLLLGERRALPDDVKKAFSDAGVIHVLAVSGLHVGLVMTIFLSLLRAIRLSFKGSAAATICLLLLYAHLTNLRPSVVRASIMGCIVLLGLVLEREGNIFNNLGFAGLVILALTPRALFDLGFQLSFGATFSIVYFYSRFGELLPPSLRPQGPALKRWLLGGLLVSFAAQVGTTPLVVYHFGRVPLISLVANLVVVPLVGLAAALGFTGSILAAVSQRLANLYFAADGVVLAGLLRSVALFSRFPWAHLNVAPPSLPTLLVYYLLLILGANAKRSLRAGKLFAFGLLICLNAVVWTGLLARPEVVKIAFLDVGQGDAAVVQLPRGEVMVIDGGDRAGGYDNGSRVVAPYLRQRGIDTIDLMVMTHPHSDHVGGLPALLDEFKVKEVVEPGQVYPSGLYQEFLEKVQDEEAAYRIVRDGDLIEGYCPVDIEVIHPTDDFVTPEGWTPYNINNGSVVFKMTFRGVSILFTGDAEVEAEESMLSRGEDLKCTILKVGHHGSRTSSSQHFLDSVRPEMAVVCVGTDNKFGHPAPETLSRYEQMGIAVYRTDLCGAVMVETDGRTYSVKTMRQEEN